MLVNTFDEKRVKLLLRVVNNFFKEYVSKNPKSHQATHSNSGSNLGNCRTTTTQCIPIKYFHSRSTHRRRGWKTLVSASCHGITTGTKTAKATEVGKKLAEAAVAAGITTVVFDRGGSSMLVELKRLLKVLEAQVFHFNSFLYDRRSTK